MTSLDYSNLATIQGFYTPDTTVKYQDRIIDSATGTSILQINTNEVSSNEPLNMNMNVISNLGNPVNATDSVNKQYVDGQKNKIQDQLTSAYLLLDSTELYSFGITNANMSNTIIQCKTDKSLANSAVNVAALETDFKTKIQSTDIGSGIDQVNLNNNSANVIINNSNKLQIGSSTSTFNTNWTTPFVYNGLAANQITSDQQVPNKLYVDSAITTSLANYVPQAKYARFQSFDDSVWTFATHDLFNQGSVYILKPANNCFVQSFNAYTGITLVQSGGFQYLRASVTGIYNITINMNVRLGIPQSAIPFSTWLNQHLFSRHNRWPSNGPISYRYASLLSGFTENSGQLLFKGHRSIFEVCNGLLYTRSGTDNDLFGGSYDQMSYTIQYSGMVQLLGNTNYFPHAPVLFNASNAANQVISACNDCTIDIQLLD